LIIITKFGGCNKTKSKYTKEIFKKKDGQIKRAIKENKKIYDY